MKSKLTVILLAVGLALGAGATEAVNYFEVYQPMVRSVDVANTDLFAANARAKYAEAVADSLKANQSMQAIIAEPSETSGAQFAGALLGSLIGRNSSAFSGLTNQPAPGTMRPAFLVRGDCSVYAYSTTSVANQPQPALYSYNPSTRSWNGPVSVSALDVAGQ